MVMPCREPLNPLIKFIISICRTLADLLMFILYSLGKKIGAYLEEPYRLEADPKRAVLPVATGERLNVAESPDEL